MALTADLLGPNQWLHGGPKSYRRPGAGTLATAKRIYLGALAMAVDGVAQPVVSGASMAALCTLIAGADANGGVYLSARDGNVRVEFLTGGNNRTFGIIVAYGSTTDISIQLDTDGGGVATTTAKTLCDKLRAHAEANRYLRCKPQGTGASATAAAAIGAVKHICLLGANQQQQLDNSDGVADLALLPSHCFAVGTYGVLAAANNAPTVNGEGWLSDDFTVTKVDDPLAFRVPVRHTDKGLYFVDLQEAA